MKWSPRYKLILQTVITLLVLVFVAIAFWNPLQQLWEHPVDWQEGYLVCAGLAYLVGISFSMSFWWLSMLSLGQQPVPMRVPWAYFLGHLAKYVPGKALVVLLRTVLVKGPRCKLEVAATTVVYETVVFMAVGALFAAGVVLIQGPLGERLNYLHVALLLAGAVPLMIPPVFNAIMHRLTFPLRKLPDGTHAPFPRLGIKILGLGVLLQSCCSVLMGVSLALVVIAVRSDINPWPMLPELVAKLAAATVLGFVIPTPAGLGTREWAIMVLLQNQIGADYAALVALLLRITWLISECAMVVFLLPFRNVGEKSVSADAATSLQIPPLTPPPLPPGEEESKT
ncbi:MAG: flippase-like domain-containing protein [Planctomycetia bacterium]|nr:flippase-like domain-containing protein [Planctomycetia bacterium]